MAGSEYPGTPATTPGPIPPITPAPGEDGAYEDESAKRGCPLDSARIRDWYRNSGHNHTETDLKNAEGLILKGHHWEVPNPRGKVVLVHGYGVHSRFEYLRHDHMNPSTPPVYEGSWIHQLNDVQMSVHCLDHQSFGGSQGHKGKRGHVLELEHLPRDLIQFLHEQVLPSQDSKLPIFICGISMGGCVTARVIEILGGGPTTSIKKSANNTDSVDVSGASTEGSKQVLPIRGAACLAPMFRLDRLKKKHKIFLPSIKALSSLFPALEIGKPAKNQLYPFFEEMLHADPLCYTGKSRARMSHEMLRAVATVQEQAHYLAFPDPSVKTSQSPLPLPVYVPETPALLIVHSQNDTFVDPEGSIIVGATVHAKLHGNSEIVEKYQGLYDQISSGKTSVDHPDANLWLLDKMWHCLSKEHPDADILIDRLIKEWILPHLGGDEGEKKTEKKENEKKKKGGKDEKKEETAPSAATGEQEKDEKHKKKDKKKENTTPEESSSVPPPAAPAVPAEDVSPPSGESAQPSSVEEEKKEEPAPPVSSQPIEETQAEGGHGASSPSISPPPALAEGDKPVPAAEAPVEEPTTTEKEKEEERKSPEPSPPPPPQESNSPSQEEAPKSEEVNQGSEEGKDEPAKKSAFPLSPAVEEKAEKTPDDAGAGEISSAPAREKQQEEQPSAVNDENTEKAPSPPPVANEEAGQKDEESPAAAAPVTGGYNNEDDGDL